jgi:hypothetical protein
MAKKKRGRRMSAIPFTKKWFSERKLSKLSKEAEKLSTRTSDLQQRVEIAKDEAYRTFTASAYERATSKIDEAMNNICESAEEARETPTGKVKTGKDVKKKCREAVGAGPTGGMSPEKNAAWKACVEKGGPSGGFRVVTPGLPATP